MNYSYVSREIQDAIIAALIMRPQCFYELRNISGFIFDDERKPVFEYVHNDIEENGKVDYTLLNNRLSSLSSTFDYKQSIKTSNPMKFAEYITNAIESYRRGVEAQNATELLLQLDTKELTVDQAQLQHGQQREMLNDVFLANTDTREAIISRARTGLSYHIEPTKFKSYNANSKGLMITAYNIIGARPGMGKTTFMLDLIEGLVNKNIPACVISYEMSAELLYLTYACKLSGVKKDIVLMSEDEIKGLPEGEKYERSQDMLLYDAAYDEILNKPIHIYDVTNFGTTIEQLVPFIQMLTKKYGIKYFFGDYLQLMSASGSNEGREKEVAYISGILKYLPTRLAIHITFFVQLNRAVETRGGSKRPQLSDIRESGSIEQDAFDVFALYRPEYYNIIEDGEGDSTRGLMEVIPLKGRLFNKFKDIKLRYIPKTNSYQDWDDDYDDDFAKVLAEPFSPRPPADNKVVRKSKLNDDEDIPF